MAPMVSDNAWAETPSKPIMAPSFQRGDLVRACTVVPQWIEEPAAVVGCVNPALSGRYFLLKTDSLGLSQPESHSHVPVHRGRGGELLASLIRSVRPAVNFRKPETAMRHHGVHAERLGERKRFTKMNLAGLRVEPVGMDRDLAEQKMCMCRESGLKLGSFERLPAQAIGVVHASQRQRSATEPQKQPSEQTDITGLVMLLEQLLPLLEQAQRLG